MAEGRKPPSRKGVKATPAQTAALNKGRASRHKELQARKARVRPEKSRHQMLIDGELTIHDMDDQELQKFRGRDINGEFVGSTQKDLPPKLIQQIRDLHLKRMRTIVESFAPRAAEILQDIAETSEHEPSRVKAADLLMQRGAGKVPDVVRVGVEDPWGVALDDFLKEQDEDSAIKARERLDRMNAKAGEE